MSTNTTSTSNGGGNGASRPKDQKRTKSSLSGEPAGQYPFGTFPLPDPATLERLANEFFKAMPRDLADGDGMVEDFSSRELSGEMPVIMFEEILPEEGPSAGTANFATSPPYSQPGPL